MFENNNHGAGYMTARNGKVEIHKGFMNTDDLLRQLDREHFTKADPVVYHFRISTQAGVNPEMTHPFPLTHHLADCKELDLLCKCGIAHNGIIRLTSDAKEKEYSDTALFITRYLTKLVRKKQDLRDKAVLDIIQQLTCSKLAIMDGTGYIALVGNYNVHNGCLYSNSTYKVQQAPKHLPFTRWKYPTFDDRDLPRMPTPEEWDALGKL